MESRFLRISYVDDRDARIRTVTIVEDLGKAPYQVQYTGSAGMRTVWQATGADLRGRGGRANGNGAAAMFRGVAHSQAPGQAQQPSSFVNARIGATSGTAPAAGTAALAVPAPVATRSGDGNEQEQDGNEDANNAGPPPPPYKQHQWQSIV